MSPRVYERHFDWEEARRRVGAGEPTARVARDLGVSSTAVHRVVDPDYYRISQERVDAFQRSGVCPDCGAPSTRKSVSQSSRCTRCATKARTTSVRENELQCYTCQRWFPDEAFARNRSDAKRRGRHGQCAQCNTRSKRAYRKRNPGRG